MMMMSIALWYCVEMNANIVKLFTPPGRNMSLVFLSATAVTKFQGELSGGIKYTSGWKFFFDFRQKSPFISETVRDRPTLLWITNRKS